MQPSLHLMVFSFPEKKYYCLKDALEKRIDVKRNNDLYVYKQIFNIVDPTNMEYY